jgi:hypothetical protein
VGSDPQQDDHSAAVALKRLFDDIASELDEQSVHYDTSGTLSLNPIAFHISVLDGRVWKCASTMERRLRTFDEALKQNRLRTV